MQRKQCGMTLIGWVIVISLVGIQALMALRIIPVYMDYYSIKKVMDELVNDDQARGMSPENMRGLINTQLRINNIYTLQDNKDAFHFERTGQSTIVILNYESRGPISGNLEFVATFDYQVEVPNK